jgi:hypothetical protein
MAAGVLVIVLFLWALINPAALESSKFQCERQRKALLSPVALRNPHPSRLEIMFLSWGSKSP